MEHSIQLPQVVWLTPKVQRGRVTWATTCAAMLSTPEAVASRKRAGIDTFCFNSAKVSVNGTGYCIKHAGLVVLKLLAGDLPTNVKDD